MTIEMLKYSQVVWAYFILDAATLVTAKLTEIPSHKSNVYKVQEEQTEITPSYKKRIDSNAAVESIRHEEILPTPLGLFVAQPSNIQELIHEPTFESDSVTFPESRYARNFGYMLVPKNVHISTDIYPKSDLKMHNKLKYFDTALQGNTRYSSSDMFAKNNKKFIDNIKKGQENIRYITPDSFPKNDKKLFDKPKYYDSLMQKKDRYLAPNKFSKNDKILFDELKYPPELKYPDMPAQGSNRYIASDFIRFKSMIDRETDNVHKKGLKMNRDTKSSPTTFYQQPFNYKSFSNKPRKIPIPIAEESYKNPYVYGDDSYDDRPYIKPVSYQQYSSLPSSPSKPYYPSENYYDPPSDYSYPSHPNTDSEPYTYSPRSESEARTRYYNDYDVNPPISSSNYQQENPAHSIPSRKPSYFTRESEDTGQTVDDDEDFQSPSQAQNFDSDDYDSKPLKESNSDVSPYRPKIRDRMTSQFGTPYRDPSPINDEETDDFDGNYESSPDPFLDSNDEIESDDEEEPEGRLRQPSRKETKRVPADRKKRCIKKRKEMSADDISAGNIDESKEMTCLVCENLDTGGTYETCSYESEPKKNSYFVGNEELYKKSGGGKNPYKYRTRRQTMTIINSSAPLRRVLRRSYNEDSGDITYGNDEEFGPEYLSDNYENEEHQDEEEDDLEEYKPSPPAYANENACREVIKNGATCMVCRNPETNGKYEQCSYATEPQENSYEYAQSSRYGSKKAPPYKERFRRNSGIRKQKGKNETEPITSQESRIPAEWKQLRKIEQKKIESVNDNFKDLLRKKKELPKLDLFNIENPSYEEQFLNLFPELSGGSAGEPLKSGSLLNELEHKSVLSPSKDEHIPGFDSKPKLTSYFKNLPTKSILDDHDEDTDMSKMMREFKTKDRSACKKTFKDKMTCYVCNDEDGMKREECMYVTESEPTKVSSYHETKETKTPDVESKSSKKREVQPKQTTSLKYKYLPPFESERGDQPSSNTIVRKPTVANITEPATTEKSKSFSNIKIQAEYSLEGVPGSSAIRKSLPKVLDAEAKSSGRRQRYKKGRTDAKRDDDENLEEPDETGEYSSVEVAPEADPNSPDGAFSEETRPVYDPELKVTLPRYMVEKNEQEKIIDDFLRKM